ncbi:TetR family transcriptional regulator [Saccharomonospora sp. NPDC006951]
MTTSQGEPVGLRERKKARTRAAIQDHALRLFVAQGYAATTVEQIAAAAEVSPSTFFRYFPTKEDTVLYDQLDPVFVECFLAQPAEVGPLAAMRAALREVGGNLGNEESERERARQRLIFEVPELRSRLLEQVTDNLKMFNDAVAERIGRDSRDANLRAWTGAVIGVVVSAYFTVLEDGGSVEDLLEQVDSALALLDAGLPL